jgi:DNA-binding Lrp family transcriptional regulator
MDEIDLFILRQLFENSRITYRELSNQLGDMSISAIHKRINNLVDIGAIKEFISRPSMLAMKYIWIRIWGISNVTSSMEETIQILGQHENVESIGLGGGKFLNVVGHLRNISEMQSFSTFVTTTAKIKDPIIGIVNYDYITVPEPLTNLDFKIIKSLHHDSRKPISDVSDEVGLSAKTVKKRIDRLTENKLVKFTVQWRPMINEGITTLYDIHLREDMEISSTVRHIQKKYEKNLVFCYSFSNLVNRIALETWSRTAAESYQLQNDLHNEGFTDLSPRIIISGDYFETWLDQLIRSK